MKKIVFCFLLLGLPLMAIPTYAKPYEVNELINLLDLSKVSYNNRSGYAVSDVISVNAGNLYTLVFDDIFANDIYNYYDLIYLNIDYGEDIEEYEYRLDGKFIYSEFIALSDQLQIINWSISFNGGNAMLYEGSYDEFKGFIPYFKEEVHNKGYLTINYDEIYSTDKIKNMVKAKHPLMDQDLETTIIYNEYTNNYSVGNKRVVFETIYENIRYEYELYIQIVDLTPPKIIGPDKITVDATKTISTKDILKNYRVEDNASNLSADDIKIIEDNYNQTKDIGLYEIKLEVTDESNNQTTKSITIEVVDKKAPVVIGPTRLFIYNTDEPLTVEEILDKLDIYDEADNTPITHRIIDDTYQMTKVPGKYRMMINFADSLGNSQDYSIVIVVLDNKRPEFIVDELIIETNTKNILDEQEVIDQYRDHVRKIGFHPENIEVLKNEYLDNEQKVGSYYIYLGYDINDVSHNDRILVHVNKHSTDYKWIIIPVSLLFIASISFVLYRKKKKIA